MVMVSDDDEWLVGWSALSYPQNSIIAREILLTYGIWEGWYSAESCSGQVGIQLDCSHAE
eukprot:scaffold1690_cov177-Ochromonas_danica.AAC.9